MAGRRRTFAPGYWRYRDEFPTPMPGKLVWFVRGHLSAAEAATLLELIAVQAQVLLSIWVALTDRAAGCYDWSLDAAAAVKIIDSYISSPRSAVSDTAETPWILCGDNWFTRLLDFGQLIEQLPDLADRGWAGDDDAALDHAATQLAKHLPCQWCDPHEADLCRLAHTTTDHVFSLRAVGVRSALYRYRRDQAGTLTVRQATAWFAGRPARLAVVTDDTSDTELARLAAGKNARPPRPGTDWSAPPRFCSPAQRAPRRHPGPAARQCRPQPRREAAARRRLGRPADVATPPARPPSPSSQACAITPSPRCANAPT
jgi:hypothetical protein